VLDEIPFNIFGIIQPKLAIFTTPNQEYNVLFDLPTGKFRHYDHKFEWTRAEFQDWSHNICQRFPDYCVQFQGIGKPPEGKEELGSVSQLALFLRKDLLEALEQTKAENETEIECFLEQPQQQLIPCDDYSLVYTVDYPFFQDLRNREEKLLDDCKYYLNKWRYFDCYLNDDFNRVEVPLDQLAGSCGDEVTVEEILELIKEMYTIDGAFVILEPDDEGRWSNVDEEEEEEPMIESLNITPRASLITEEEDW